MQALRDPIHRNILLEPWAVDVIDSGEMQRLRRIRQLGTAYLVYPGANHSRFEHSLGAHKLAQDATRAFGFTVEESRTVQAAALLHDVGHGPLSHLFEEVSPEQNLHHEEFGADLIRWSGLADRLRTGGIEPRKVAELMMGKGPHAALVSGDIDVDRMDYLVRDAHYTGLRVSVDPDRILLTLAWHEGQVLVREEGLTAVEALLLARFLMYPAVYFHHTCRAAEVMLTTALRRLVDDGADMAELRRLDDAQAVARLEAAPGLPREIAKRINERRLYKRVFEGTKDQIDQDPLLRRLVDDPKERRGLENELCQELKIAEGELSIDSPRPPLAREVEARLLRRDGTVEPVKRVSTTVRNLLSAQMDHWRFWVFAAKEHQERAQRAFERRLGGKRVK